VTCAVESECVNVSGGTIGTDRLIECDDVV